MKSGSFSLTDGAGLFASQGSQPPPEERRSETKRNSQVMPTSQAANKHTPGNAAPSGIHQPRQQLLWMGGSGGQKETADQSRTGLWAQGSLLLSRPLPSSLFCNGCPGTRAWRRRVLLAGLFGGCRATARGKVKLGGRR